METLWKAARSLQADIVICQYQPFYNIDSVSRNEITADAEWTELCTVYHQKTFDFVMQQGFATSPCNKLYNAEILRTHHIFFHEWSSYGEDMFFNWKAFLISSRICYAPVKLYFYRQAKDSATARYYPNLFETYMREYDELRVFAEEYGIPRETLERSIAVNLSGRIPAFLRMNVRMPASGREKRKALKTLVDSEMIQSSAKAGLQENDNNRKLYEDIVRKRYLRVYCCGCYHEMRFRLSRKLKNF